MMYFIKDGASVSIEGTNRPELLREIMAELEYIEVTQADFDAHRLANHSMKPTSHRVGGQGNVSSAG